MPSRRPRKRVLAAGLTCLVLAGVGGRLLWRGTMVEPPPAPPSHGDEGSRAALVAEPGQRPRLWCSRVVDAPVPVVFGVITDYPAFPGLFPDIVSLTGTPGAGGQVELSGVVRVLGRAYPLVTTVTHEPGATRARVHWSTSTEAMPVNRGSWQLEDLGGRTRVTYSLDLEVRGMPGWMVRGYLVDRLPEVLDAVAAEGTRRGGGAS